MFCYKCGKQLDDDSKFCERCGIVINQNKESVKTENTTNNDDLDKFNKLFIDKSEKTVSLLGSSYMMNYANSGELKKGFCLLSDKRIYYRGKSYKKEGEQLVKTTEETIIDVKDITASGFIESSNTALIVRCWILLSLTLYLILIFPLPTESWDYITKHLQYTIIYLIDILLIIFTTISFAKYFLQKVKLFYIAFAGGTLAFKATDYSYNDVCKFNRSLRKIISSKYHDNN